MLADDHTTTEREKKIELIVILASEVKLYRVTFLSSEKNVEIFRMACESAQRCL